MRVRVLLFGMMKDLTGQNQRTLELPAGAVAADVLEQFRATAQLRRLLPSLAIAVNQEYAQPQTPLHDGDEIGLLPPVSGGNNERNN